MIAPQEYALHRDRIHHPILPKVRKILLNQYKDLKCDDFIWIDTEGFWDAPVKFKRLTGDIVVFSYLFEGHEYDKQDWYYSMIRKATVEEITAIKKELAEKLAYYEIDDKRRV